MIGGDHFKPVCGDLRSVRLPAEAELNCLRGDRPQVVPRADDPKAAGRGGWAR